MENEKFVAFVNVLKYVCEQESSPKPGLDIAYGTQHRNVLSFLLEPQWGGMRIHLFKQAMQSNSLE